MQIEEKRMMRDAVKLVTSRYFFGAPFCSSGERALLLSVSFWHLHSRDLNHTQGKEIKCTINWTWVTWCRDWWNWVWLCLWPWLLCWVKNREGAFQIWKKLTSRGQIKDASKEIYNENFMKQQSSSFISFLEYGKKNPI